MVGGGNDERDRCQSQHCCLCSSACQVKVLFRISHSPGKHGSAKDEKDISNDRAHNRGFHNVIEAGTKSCECNDKFCGVAESCVEKASYAFARPVCQLLGCPPEPRG